MMSSTTRNVECFPERRDTILKMTNSVKNAIPFEGWMRRPRRLTFKPSIFVVFTIYAILSKRFGTAFQNAHTTKYAFGRTSSIMHSTPSTQGSRTWSLQQRPNESEDRSRSRKKMQPMPVRGYDAASIEHYYDRRPLQVGWRLNSLGFPLLGKLFSSQETY